MPKKSKKNKTKSKKSQSKPKKKKLSRASKKSKPHFYNVFKSKQEEGLEMEIKKQDYKILRGMRDILSDEWRYWDYFLSKAESLAKDYGYKRIETPVLENLSLFERSTGLSSDVVSKQMYTFRDKSGEKICLRPEITPSIVRAYIEKGLFQQSQPVKLYYFGPIFRYERPQKGRYRQFYQFGLEVIGASRPTIDAEIILFSKILFESLGLKVNFQINSIGCLECRKNYRQELLKFLRKKRKALCPDCQRRISVNPLRVLDCKNKNCQEILSSAPQIVDYLCEDCYKHFVKVLEYLDAAGMVYNLNPFLVRGLDYYTRTVFEIFPEKTIDNSEDEQIGLSPDISLGGGGRYDNLVGLFSSRNVPACGVAYGVDRIVEELKIQKPSLSKERKIDIYLAQIGDRACRRVFSLFEELRQNNLKCFMNLGKESLRAQLDQANSLGVKYVLILGDQEMKEDTIIVRNMVSGVQEVISQDKLVNYLKAALSSR